MPAGWGLEPLASHTSLLMSPEAKASLSTSQGESRKRPTGVPVASIHAATAS